jgi:hypothetical protein
MFVGVGAVEVGGVSYTHIKWDVLDAVEVSPNDGSRLDELEGVEVCESGEA